MMHERLASKHIVLLGIGHTNAHVLRMWSMHPMADTDMTCISDSTVATYSGMLPAALAGQITQSEMEIDLVRLCASAGARLITEPVTGLDHDKQLIAFANRPSIPYDVMSVGIGSVPFTCGVTMTEPTLVKIKPMQTFLGRLRSSLELRRPTDARPLRVTIVGSGVAGIEITLCLPPFLQSMGIDQAEISIVTRSAEILPEFNASARRQALTALRQRGTAILVGKAVKQVLEREILLDDGTCINADIVIWATGASAPPLLNRLGLPQDERGFIATDSTLRSISGHPIFAVGDSGSIVNHPIPKAGVHAVRQGPILWDNIERQLHGRELQRYEPQSTFLKLLNTGDGKAIGVWRGVSFSGRWVKGLKDRIDTTFINKYRPSQMSSGMEPMQCRGCGSKLGASVLQAAIDATLATKTVDGDQRVAIEDAVEIGSDSGGTLVASTDFFTSPFDDAFLSGRIAALHSASDIVITGARVTKALANVVLPEGDRASQQRMLSDFLAGARMEFDAMGASIVGGHTIVGPRMEVGFTVIGRAYSPTLLRKSNLKPNDQLFLIKPLGIGVLLAAHMRNCCSAQNYTRLLDTMLWRQHEFAKLAIESGIVAATDITGFGVAGHLLEMLSSSGVTATIFLDDIPALDGSIEAIESGIESSLMEDNLQADDSIYALAKVRGLPKYRLLFDPQTCGGFLFGCSEDVGRQFLNRIEGTLLPTPKYIGHCDVQTGDKQLRVELS
jgi:selenide, water dikinase